MRPRTLVLIAGILPAACATAPPPLPPTTAAFSPERFFVGRTEGVGTLKILLSPARALRVEGVGRIEADGTLVLDQRVSRAGHAEERRQWRLRETAPGRYTGTLSDARGPVTFDVQGARLHLRYRTRDQGLVAEQWLDLKPDGRTVLNHLAFTKFGLRVATLEETIRAVDR